MKYFLFRISSGSVSHSVLPLVRHSRSHLLLFSPAEKQWTGPSAFGTSRIAKRMWDYFVIVSLDAQISISQSNLPLCSGQLGKHWWKNLHCISLQIISRRWSSLCSMTFPSKMCFNLHCPALPSSSLTVLVPSLAQGDAKPVASQGAALFSSHLLFLSGYFFKDSEVC